MESLILHEDRYFDSDPTVRRIARALYDEVRDLPLVCPHGHVDPQMLAENKPFEEPASLLIKPDHYVFRMLYSQGISLEELGIPALDGTPVESNPRKIWQRFASAYYLFAGTPTRAWLDYELYHIFGVRFKLDGSSAKYIYDQILERLQTEEFLPRALFDQYRIEALTTTDAASDTLEYHQEIKASNWKGRVIPCFRPDAVFKITSPAWRDELEALAVASGKPINAFARFIEALEKRRRFFKKMGAVSTDHGVFVPRTHALSEHEAERLFDAALSGTATVKDEAAFQAHMLMEMARMSIVDGLVMQIHPGSYRNHNQFLFDRFGTDKGADIPVNTEYTHNLKELLNTYGNDPRLTLICFTLDETTYGRELAPLAGHYPALKLGPAWWFFDSIEGMRRYREWVTETAGVYNTVGFNDDTRAFLSIPARHDLSRRVDANYVAGLVARHVVDMSDARVMVRAFAYDLVRTFYRLDREDDAL